MGQPVKLSDSLVRAARINAEHFERSIAGQIEYWAGLGRALDTLMRPALALKLQSHAPRPLLSESLADIGSDAARARARAYLDSRPYPQFEAAPKHPGYIVKIDADGTRTLGRFVKRTFVPKDE